MRWFLLALLFSGLELDLATKQFKLVGVIPAKTKSGKPLGAVTPLPPSQRLRKVIHNCLR